MTARRTPPPLIALSPGDLVPSRVDQYLRGLRGAVEAGLSPGQLVVEVTERAAITEWKTFRPQG